MKKQFLILFTTLGMAILASCNSKTNKNENSTLNLSTVESNKSLEPKANDSDQNLSFTFNGEVFKNDPTRLFELEATHAKGDNWIISFIGLDSEDYKQVTLSFNLTDYKLTTGKFNILNCTISLSDFEDMDASSTVLSSVDHHFLLDITSVEKIKTETDLGVTTDFYTISGTFSGEFGNMTGTKTFKVENGTFNNYTLHYIQKN